MEDETELEQEPDSMEEMEENMVTTNQIYIKIGENILTAVLENNESANALKEFPADGE